MMCPHCNKPLKVGVTPEIKRKVIHYHKIGCSLRDIEFHLDRKISYSTAGRIVKEYKELQGLKLATERGVR